MRSFLVLFAALLVSGCAVSVVPTTPVVLPNGQSPQSAVASFLEVVDRVEPVAEDVCREMQPGLNCDFEVIVERDPRAGVNAFHTVTRSGRPLIIYTIGLIAEAQNADELAFVMGHEAAHHIERHLPQRAELAEAGADFFGELARRQGATSLGVSRAQELGSIVAARTYGQQAELEADRLGAVIAYRSGYDPIRGAAFFARLPDPSGAFLSTHPPNAARIATVRDTVADLNAF